jgi:hypothetical protein
MTVDVVRQHAKLNFLLDRLQAGQHVQNRDLEIWLTEDAWASYKAEVDTQKKMRVDVQDKPEAVREYERLVRLANLAYNKGEGASVRGKSATARKHLNKSDALYERALEHLHEVVAADRSLCVWFDRDTEHKADSEIGLCPNAMPHVVTSRSLVNRGGGILGQLRSKRDVKIWAIEMALAELSEDNSHLAEEVGVSARMAHLLALRDND